MPELAVFERRGAHQLERAADPAVDVHGEEHDGRGSGALSGPANAVRQAAQVALFVLRDVERYPGTGELSPERR